ncbi:MAG: hypothetical protein ABIE84_01280, partial [bacterium]
TTTTNGSGGVATSTTTSTTSAPLFNVSGAVAIASASNSSLSSAGLSAMGIKVSDTDANDLMKLTENGSLESILNIQNGYYPNITVIEVAPDGTLYVGFSSQIYDYSSYNYSAQGAFFRIFPSGTYEVVDADIDAIYTWYSYAQNGELPVKQVQFDDAGNVYYLGYSNDTYARVLKKKAPDGTITRIGNDNMYVRDFVVCPNGTVLFHGSSSSSYSVEWLRVINPDSSVKNVFYNDGTYGWLRAYFKDVNNNVILVGSNLVLLDEDLNEKTYKGIIRIPLTDGVPGTPEALYDDYNMYNDSYSTIGSQLNYGYWDPQESETLQFFSKQSYSTVNPISLEAGVTEDDVKEFIRNKFQSFTSDTLDNITFEGMATTESWVSSDWLDSVVNANIQGTTWAQWRTANGLDGVDFASAAQLLFADSGAVYAVIDLDNWGSVSKGDRLYRIIDETGEPSIEAFPQHSSFKSISRIRLYGDYAIYSSSKLGYYKIYRLDLTDNSLSPVDMIPDYSDVEIYSFSYNPVNQMLMFDVYDLSNNTSYLAQQEITETEVASLVEGEGNRLIDVVPFEADEETSTTTTTLAEDTVSTTTTTSGDGETTTTTVIAVSGQ